MVPHGIVVLFNLDPIVGVLGAGPLAELYGLIVSDRNLLLVLRHRAMLFGLIGTLLIVAAFRLGLRNLAAALRLVSLGSFCVLALPLADINDALQRVFWINLVAIALFAAGVWLAHRQHVASRIGQAGNVEFIATRIRQGLDPSILIAIDCAATEKDKTDLARQPSCMYGDCHET